MSHGFEHSALPSCLRNGESTNDESTGFEDTKLLQPERAAQVSQIGHPGCQVPKISKLSGETQVLRKRHIASILLRNCHHKKDKNVIICSRQGFNA